MKEDITGCRFSLSVMSDNYAEIILNAIKEVNTNNIWSATDALSTTYRGARIHVVDGLKGVFTKVNDGKTHITMEAVFSKGCPMDVETDCVLPESGNLLNQNEIKFDVIGKMAFYPLGTEEYMEHIAAVVQIAEEQKIYKGPSHYASEIEGDVNEVFDYFNKVLEYAEKNLSHYVLQTTLSLNSPSLKGELWNLYKWKLKDVILASIISVLFAFICFAAVHSVSFVVAPIVMPFGFGDIAIEFVFGIFFMSAVLAGYIIQKPGAAVIVGTMTGVVQVLMGSAFAATLLPSAFFQGVGVEIAFLLARYKKFTLPVVLLAAVGPTVTSFILAWYRGLWAYLDPNFVAVRFFIRLCSALIFSGIITKFLADRLAKAGVLKSYPLGAKYAENIDDDS